MRGLPSGILFGRVCSLIEIQDNQNSTSCPLPPNLDPCAPTNVVLKTANEARRNDVIDNYVGYANALWRYLKCDGICKADSLSKVRGYVYIPLLTCYC